VVYFAAIICLKMGLSLVLLTALFGKRSEGLFSPLDGRQDRPPLTELLNLIHAPFVVALVYLLLGPSPLFALVMLAVMMVLGYLIKKSGIAGPCNCYGELAAAGTKKYLAFNLSLFVAGLVLGGLILFGQAGGQSAYTLRPTILFVLSLALSALLANTEVILNSIRRLLPLGVIGVESVTRMVTDTQVTGSGSFSDGT
jgi:hypothetical protein